MIFSQIIFIEPLIKNAPKECYWPNGLKWMADNLTQVSSVTIDRAPNQLELVVDQVKFQDNNIIQIELTFMPRVRCYMQMKACITELHVGL